MKQHNPGPSQPSPSSPQDGEREEPAPKVSMGSKIYSASTDHPSTEAQTCNLPPAFHQEISLPTHPLSRTPSHSDQLFTNLSRPFVFGILRPTLFASTFLPRRQSRQRFLFDHRNFYGLLGSWTPRTKSPYPDSVLLGQKPTSSPSSLHVVGRRRMGSLVQFFSSLLSLTCFGSGNQKKKKRHKKKNLDSPPTRNPVSVSRLKAQLCSGSTSLPTSLVQPGSFRIQFWFFPRHHFALGPAFTIGPKFTSIPLVCSWSNAKNYRSSNDPTCPLTQPLSAIPPLQLTIHPSEP
jgi:hypothetical protein